jgi:hypothetical protein
MKTDVDWKTNLIAQIVVLRGRELPTIQDEGLRSIFDSSGKSVALQAVKRLSDMPTLPSNIIGAIKREISGIEGEIRERQEWRLKSRDAATSTKECQELMAFLQELSIWHQIGLVERNDNGISIPMSIDEYIYAGRPKTWSPIIDHWLQGFEAAYRLEQEKPGALIDFYKGYTKNLIEERRKRTENQKKAA